MPLTKVAEFLKDVDVFISQHAIYINKLERAIKEGTPFEHKDCHSCNFGKRWDELVAPVKEELPEDIRAVVEEIESIHCEFHEISMQIDPENRGETDAENLERMKDLSAKLFQKLLSLKRLIDKEVKNS
ncbi:MAG: CZB domain-containing protein [Hydrogenobacter thermophilus]|uniref:CZB domain-containing protein n=1 Tax=Hydrogenobacter thermophilus TaxID=940 RepID=UPI0030F7F599|nr:CZB domain-containing protein [Hydrogenobacter thermophilus]